MRFCEIKIVFLACTLLNYSQPAVSKEYDFSFDVHKSKVSQQATNSTTTLPSTTSWRLGAQASLLPDFLEGSGELLYGDYGEDANTELSDWGKYLLRLGVSGQRNVFGYGFNFYSVGQQYKGQFNSKYGQNKGRTGYDSWVSLNIKKLKIKAKYLESWTNTSSNKAHTLSFDNWYEIETSYPLSSTPLTEISIAYRLGERSNLIVPSYISTYQGTLNLFKTKFRFVADYLKFSTEIKRSHSKNNINNQKDFQQETIYFTSTLFPQNFFSIISSYRYSIDSHSSLSYQNKLNKTESSLGLSYKPNIIPANLKLSSGYKNYRSNDGLTHKDILNFSAQFDWRSKGAYTGLTTDWTINLRYKDTTDYINPTTNTSGLSFNLLWQWPL